MEKSPYICRVSNNKHKKINKMNYLEHTTILKTNNKEYKLVRLQKYNNTTNKATNKYYIDGKLVNKQDRTRCEIEIDNAPLSSLLDSTRSWVK